MNCPKCGYGITWLITSPGKGDYCCTSCRNSWPHLREVTGRCGTFLGRWLRHEIDQVEAAIPATARNQRWNYFRGRFLFTAWKEGEDACLIRTEDIGELVTWISAAILNPDSWWEIYQRGF